MSVPLVGPVGVVTIDLSPVAVVDGREQCVYYFCSMESKTEDEYVVERYRIQLGLKPWAWWANHVAEVARRNGMTSDGRRSGRTTIGILRSIAEAQRVGARIIAVIAEPRANREYCMAQARALSLGLEISHIHIVAGEIGSIRHDVSYVDHHRPGVSAR